MKPESCTHTNVTTSSETLFTNLVECDDVLNYDSGNSTVNTSSPNSDNLYNVCLNENENNRDPLVTLENIKNVI